MSRPAKPANAAKARAAKARAAKDGAAKAGSDRQHADELLDEALAETFPASDPVEMLEPAPQGDGKKSAPKGRKSK